MSATIELKGVVRDVTFANGIFRSRVEVKQSHAGLAPVTLADMEVTIPREAGLALMHPDVTREIKVTLVIEVPS